MIEIQNMANKMAATVLKLEIIFATQLKNFFVNFVLLKK
tara:strand:- start:14720 stop:14836 length:117 start_codon:yes stop_codon:yes gene_type:complete